MRASRRRALIGAAVVVPAALSASAPVAASTAPAPSGQEDPGATYCATTMLSAEQIDAGVRSTIVCFDSLDESLRSVGLDPGTVTRSASGVPQAALNAGGLVAVHYDNVNGQGLYLNINGSGCNGGGVSFAPWEFWNDRIRSTAHRGCSTIKHWAEPQYQGDMVATTGGVTNLGSLAGRVTSVRYFGPVN